MTVKHTPGPLSQVQIPDLWEISQLKELEGYSLGGRKAGELIKETWHIAHDLRKANAQLLAGCKALVEDLENNGERFQTDEARLGYLYSLITKAEGSAT